MKLTVVILLTSLAGLTRFVEPLFRETNSMAASRRGFREYNKDRYSSAERSFRQAAELAPGPRSSFNLGTTQVAAGNVEQGAATLNRSLADRKLRGHAYYNRGNAALTANAVDHAVADYINALRINPRNQKAKRNLEIALRRKQSENASQSSSKQEGQTGASEEPRPEQESPKPGKQQYEQTPEALLQAVEQQEREELQRMRRVRGQPKRIGW